MGVSRKAPLSLFYLLAFLFSITMTEATEKDFQRRMMVGAYQSITDLENDSRVKEATIFAVSDLAASTKSYSFLETFNKVDGFDIKVIKGSRQVVAGMNYRLFLLLTQKETGDCIGSFAVEVYDRFGDISVTNWGKELSCDEAKLLVESEKADDYENFEEHFSK